LPERGDRRQETGDRSSASSAAPDFGIRGLKGLWWEPEQYLGWPAFLEQAGLDFFMLCYTFCPESGLSWRQPFRAAELEIIRRLADDCAARGITLCVALHPLIGGQAWSPEQAAVRFHPTSGQSWFLRYWQARRPTDTLRPDRPIRYGSDEDLKLLSAKCRQMYDLGVGAIALCLDDVEPGTTPPGFADLAAAHVWLIEGIGYNAYHGAPPLRGIPTGLQVTGENDPPPLSPSRSSHVPRLLVVPTYYWTAGARAHLNYTAGLARGLSPDVGVFWTGPEVRSHAITADHAREAAGLFGRKPIVWFNYASNDSFRFAVQLPPDRPPAADLLTETAGLLVNSTRQVGLAHLDALGIGTYLADPGGYDHAQAVERAVRELVGETAAPQLLRIFEAWRAVPDVRTLTRDLAEGGRSLLLTLLARLRPAADEIKVVLAHLQPLMLDGAPEHARPRQIWQELAAGSERLRFLVAALEVLAIELAAAGTDGLVAAGPEHSKSMVRELLSARLATIDPELACDAEAVLSLMPV
jgi:hypothetical protein